MARTVSEWIGKTDNTPIPPRVKARIFAREKGICYLSGRKIAAGEPVQYDHVIALINGGKNCESNIKLALADKHKIKTKDDLAEKAKVASVAKKYIGAIAPKQPIPAPVRASTAKQPRISKTPLQPKAIYRWI